ncbi:MarR family transcriptional regulator [Paenibacillus sp. MWE-103]|uniref:MarR family transcriptional regulator n=1 Tax=Paenibacillus artemisiicola TaxID=1172618 RepID=A0ABS3W3A6_9BACL|nr:MarR family transcriptional regulator [Paenibacillus artemisiicola]MBO7742789.1 MarR family transcriptional regulator [Paenibacillus artemisiicola]
MKLGREGRPIAEPTGKEKKLSELLLLVQRWGQRAKNSLKTVENPFQLANGQIVALMYLQRNGACRVNDVARILGITSGAATGLTDKLVGLGLVERTRQENDRRVVLLSLTEKGAETINMIWEQRSEWFAGIVGQLDEAKIDVVLEAFGLLLQALESHQTPEPNKEVER